MALGSWERGHRSSRLPPSVRRKKNPRPRRDKWIARGGIVGRIIRDARRQVGIRAAAVDSVIGFPEPAARPSQDLRAGIVDDLAGGALFGGAESRGEFNALQDRQRNGANEVVAVDTLPSIVVFVIRRDLAGGGVLFDPGHLGAETRFGPQVLQNCFRQ